MGDSVTGNDIVKMLDAGIKPVVDFNSDFEAGSYAEKGMRARVIDYDCYHLQDGTVRLHFDFDEFFGMNQAYELRVFRDKQGKPCLTGREYGLLKNGIEQIYVELHATNPEFSLTKGTALFFEFKELGTSQAYVTWLEQQVHMLRNQEFDPSLE